MFHPQGPTFWELAVQALSSTERGYDLLAPKFDFTPFRTPDVILDQVAELIGPAGSVNTALDVCCGTGAAMQMLRPICRDRVVGLDISQGMLEMACLRTRSAPGDARLEFVHGNALDLPFDSCFDLAVCFGALGHILPADQDQFAGEVARALRPGGRFFLVSSHRPSVLSRNYLAGRCFNAAMHLRNRVILPPFIMYYLQFLVPQAQQILERSGLNVQIVSDAFSGRFADLCVVIATRPPVIPD